jgi:hypothetical protein
MDPHQIINLEDGWSDIKTIAIEQLEVTFTYFSKMRLFVPNYLLYNRKS